MDLRATASCLTCAACALALGSCSGIRPSYEDPTPEARLGAIRETAEAGRASDVPHLVENLSSDDSAVRMAAIATLRRITGTDNGYRFDDPESERLAAISRWKAWVASHPVSR